MDAILADIQLLAAPALFNLYFAAASLPVGFVFALLLALARTGRNAPLRALANGYIYAFRGSPLFIQLFMFYSIMLALNPVWWRPLGISDVVMHPLFLAPLALVMNTAAYTAEIFTGALRTVPKGEVEAARAFGLSRAQIFRTVTWPNTIRVAWPAYTNEVVFLFHATALVYFTLPVIGTQRDLMAEATRLFERDFNAFLHYSVAGAYFLAISLVVFFIFGRIHVRMTRHLSRQTDATPRLKFWPSYLR